MSAVERLVPKPLRSPISNQRVEDNALHRERCNPYIDLPAGVRGGAACPQAAGLSGRRSQRVGDNALHRLAL